MRLRRECATLSAQHTISVSGETDVGAGLPARMGCARLMECLVVCFLRMDCRVSGVHRRRGMTGEQARPYGGGRMVFTIIFIAKCELIARHEVHYIG